MDLFLIAHIAGRPIAVAGAQVDSVVDLGDIVPVPRAGRAIRGLAALRSRVVTVIDTGVALDLVPMPADARRAVITRFEGHHYAVLVDGLEDVAPFVRQPIENGLALRGGWAAAADGLIERDGEPVLILDLARIVPGVAPAVVEPLAA